DLTNRYNELQQSYDDFKIAFNNINTEQPTIGLITTAISRAIEFEARLKEYNDSYYVARKSFDEVIGVLQSQYSDEKYNELLNDIADSVGGIVQDDGSIDMSEVNQKRLDEAMELVASAIGGTWNGNQLIADVPNREELDSLNQSIKQYLNGELDSLDGKLGKQIETVVNQAKDEFSVAIESVEKKVDGIEIGGRNLLPNSKYFGQDVWVKYLGSQIQVTDNDKSYNIKMSGGTSLIKGFYMLNELKTHYAREWVTLSIKLKNNGSPLVLAHNWAAIGVQPSLETGYDDVYTFYGQISVNAAGQIQFRTENVSDNLDFDIEWIKIEKGNKPTDWTPAPEDFENDIHNLTQEVTKNTTSLNVLENEISLKADSDTVKQILDDELEPIKS